MQPSCVRCTNMFYPSLSDTICDTCCSEEVTEEMVACGIEPYDAVNREVMETFDGDEYDDGEWDDEMQENADFERTDEYYGMWQEDNGGECG